MLRAIQTATMAHFAPEVQSTYGKAQLAFSMLLFGIAQRDYDSAVPDLIEENRRLRALLADADAALGGSLESDARRTRASASRRCLRATASLRLSDLRAEHGGAARRRSRELAPLIEPAADDARWRRCATCARRSSRTCWRTRASASVPILGA